MTPDDIYSLDFDTSQKSMGTSQPVPDRSTANLASLNPEAHHRETLGTVAKVRPAVLTSGRESLCPEFQIAGISLFDPPEPSFTVVDSLGVGGMGSVHLATQSFMGREVAVKRSHDPQGKGASFDSVIEEGRRFGQLDHPSIPPVHMVGKDGEDHAILVMKRIDGHDLHSMLQNPMHPRWANVEGDRTMWMLDLVIQISRALEHAHSRSVLHRDIKTDNIMIGDFGQVFLIDWGISIDLRDKKARTTTQKFIGTPCFAAPEMVIENSELSIQTDVYLLGALLFEIITGSVPHMGRSVEEILTKAKSGNRPDIPPNVSPSLAAIIDQALQPEREDRFRDVTAFRMAVQQYKSDHFLLSQMQLAEQQIGTLRQWLKEERIDRQTGYNFMTLAHEALAILKTVLRGGVRVQYAKQLVVENLRIQTEYSILAGQFGVARSLIAKLVEDLGPGTEWINDLAGRIADAQAHQENRDSELRTQSLAVMFEKMVELQQQAKPSEE